MKTRRLCAVIAAAATLLGGMAFGTAGAYAAGSASIEVRHSQKGHTYSAYKFASLTVDGDAVQVDTDADWVTAVTDAVAAANNNMDPVVSMPSEYDSNPAAFAATKTGDNDAAWFRTSRPRWRLAMASLPTKPLQATAVRLPSVRLKKAGISSPMWTRTAVGEPMPSSPPR